jgi:hypothetical protein
MSSIQTLRLALPLLLAGHATSAYAVDGVVLIDQNRALAGNVTPGDLPGFPVTLSQPGSYRLSSNLTVSVSLTGILATADGITIDPNGFSIIGNRSRVENVRAISNGQYGINGSGSVVRSNISYGHSIGFQGAFSSFVGNVSTSDSLAFIFPGSTRDQNSPAP